MRAVSGLAVLFMGACSGSPAAGPSPVAPQAISVSAARASFALPPALDPDYVRSLTRTTASGRPQRFEAPAFRHCFDASVDGQRAMLEAVADRMSAITGIARTTSGACNVTWKVAADPYMEVPAGSAGTVVAGTETAIYNAVVTFRFAEFVRSDFALHEGGHVLGLRHSPRASDLMNVQTPVPDFSHDELAVLAWMYGR